MKVNEISRIKYTDERGKTLSRCVLPVLFSENEKGQYAIAYCGVRKGFRMFYLKGIISERGAEKARSESAESCRMARERIGKLLFPKTTELINKVISQGGASHPFVDPQSLRPESLPRYTEAGWGQPF